MAFEQRENTGSLFKNERKEKDNQPDYKGTAMINGLQLEIGAWVKEAKTTGKKYFSLSFKAKEEHQVTQQAKPQQDQDFLPF